MAFKVTVVRVDAGATVDSGAFQTFDATSRMPFQCILQETGQDGISPSTLKQVLELARRGIMDEAVATLASGDTLAQAVAKAYTALVV